LTDQNRTKLITESRIGTMSKFLASLAILPLVLIQTSTMSDSSKAGKSVKGQNLSPVILFDDGHNNYQHYDSDEILEQFLIRHGFSVRYLKTRVSEYALEGVDVLHTTNALAPENVNNWSLPTPSAFTPNEIEILLDWVRKGGCLLLVIEHMPMGGSYRELATALGIKVSNGFVVNEALIGDYSPDNISNAADLLFLRKDGSMADHPVINGAIPYGRIEHLNTATGSAFLLPTNSTSLITLGSDVISLEPAKSWVFTDETPLVRVAGWSQAGVMEIDNGRVAVLGDNYLTSAPEYLKPPFVADETEAQRGAHNHQFTLNLYRWLTRQEVHSLPD
jgi:hypothetical protein